MVFERILPCQGEMVAAYTVSVSGSPPQEEQPSVGSGLNYVMSDECDSAFTMTLSVFTLWVTALASETLPLVTK
jgi:hypothetical protein